MIFTDPSFNVSTGTPDAGYTLIDAVFNQAEALACGTELVVEVTCLDNPACKFQDTLLIECDGCPTDITIEVVGPSGPIDPSADCIPPGDYTVTVLAPVGPTVSYNWQIDTPLGSTSSSGPGNTITVTIPPGANDGDYKILVNAFSPGCSLMASYDFPASNAGPCPDTLVIVVRQNGTVLTPPYDPLTPGTYEIEVTAPAGAVAYAFTEDSIRTESPSPVYSVSLSANETMTVVVSVDNGPCCDPLDDFVTLQGEGEGVGIVVVPIDPGLVDPRTPVVVTGNGDDDDDNGGGGGGINICAGLAAIAIGALLLALVLVLLLACGIVIGLPVILGALVVSLIAFGLLALICGWGRCRIIGAIAWCFMWGALIGAVIALICISLIVAFVAVAYAIVAGLLVLWLQKMGCPVPQPFQWP